MLMGDPLKRYVYVLKEIPILWRDRLDILVVKTSENILDNSWFSAVDAF